MSSTISSKQHCGQNVIPSTEAIPRNRPSKPMANNQRSARNHGNWGINTTMHPSSNARAPKPISGMVQVRYSSSHEQKAAVIVTLCDIRPPSGSTSLSLMDSSKTVPSAQVGPVITSFAMPPANIMYTNVVSVHLRRKPSFFSCASMCIKTNPSLNAKPIQNMPSAVYRCEHPINPRARPCNQRAPRAKASSKLLSTVCRCPELGPLLHGESAIRSRASSQRASTA
mmetsp:Transcript_135694/g.247430  ORF Transcript_135694/g.247430 Transcript_135694/m.247430 type:complete len:226 (-) Transcript_135694:847-1524(-)